MVDGPLSCCPTVSLTDRVHATLSSPGNYSNSYVSQNCQYSTLVELGHKLEGTVVARVTWAHNTRMIGYHALDAGMHFLPRGKEEGTFRVASLVFFRARSRRFPGSCHGTAAKHRCDEYSSYERSMPLWEDTGQFSLVYGTSVWNLSKRHTPKLGPRGTPGVTIVHCRKVGDGSVPRFDFAAFLSPVLQFCPPLFSLAPSHISASRRRKNSDCSRS